MFLLEMNANNYGQMNPKQCIKRTGKRWYLIFCEEKPNKFVKWTDFSDSLLPLCNFPMSNVTAAVFCAKCWSMLEDKTPFKTRAECIHSWKEVIFRSKFQNLKFWRKLKSNYKAIFLPSYSMVATLSLPSFGWQASHFWWRIPLMLDGFGSKCYLIMSLLGHLFETLFETPFWILFFWDISFDTF